MRFNEEPRRVPSTALSEVVLFYFLFLSSFVYFMASRSEISSKNTISIKNTEMAAASSPLENPRSITPSDSQTHSATLDHEKIRSIANQILENIIKYSSVEAAFPIPADEALTMSIKIPNPKRVNAQPGGSGESKEGEGETPPLTFHADSAAFSAEKTTPNPSGAPQNPASPNRVANKVNAKLDGHGKVSSKGLLKEGEIPSSSTVVVPPETLVGSRARLILGSLEPPALVNPALTSSKVGAKECNGSLADGDCPPPASTTAKSVNEAISGDSFSGGDLGSVDFSSANPTIIFIKEECAQV
ncbi:hypothetical protein OROMI_028821 [Orobanche minor]